MLKSIYIESLFGLYTYQLDIMPDGSEPIRFITGPNGYGKTTILRILHSIYTCNIKSLADIRFTSLQLYFSDGYIIKVTQEIHTEEETNSDEDVLRNINLNISLYKGTDDSTPTVLSWNSNEDTDISTQLLNIKIYLDSTPLYYLTDGRLVDSNGEAAINDDAVKMKELLTNAYNRINDALSARMSSQNADISEEEYYRLKNKFEDDINILIWSGLLKDNPLIDFDKNNIVYFSALSQSVKECMEIEQPLILKLRSLKNIISKADFANKQLEVDKTYGFRFRANNEERTIIFGDMLSSGEQQTLIMTVELLFFAPDESLVLIDEPEISCHMMWQMDFLTNLRDITKLRQLQCIVCTHSPQIFSSNWGMTVDLFTQASKKQEQP